MREGYRPDAYRMPGRFAAAFWKWLVLACICVPALVPAKAVLAGDAGGGELSYEELKVEDGQDLYVFLPKEYNPEARYPSVYFMPQDGSSMEAYIDEGTPERIRALEEQGLVPGMIYVFPSLDPKKDLGEQTESLIETVERNYPVIPQASMRGVIGTGTGGYLAFLLGYGAVGGEVTKEPLYFSAIASHEGDFTSGQNPYLASYGDVYSILKEPLASFGADTGWLAEYVTCLDASAGSDLTWADGGSADIASLYRTGGMVSEDSLPAWDYSVFDYAILKEDAYGTWQDHLNRSLPAFAAKFGLADGSGEEETETEYQAQETIASGDGRMIDLMGKWYFTTVDALEKSVPGIRGNDIKDVSAADWKSWDIVSPGFDWWTEDFAPCMGGNPYYVGYVWYVREFEVPEEFDVTGLQIEAGMVDEADEVYLNGVRVGQTGIPDEGGSYDATNPWDVERVYPIPDGLLHAGTNLVCVRVCNGSGGGGWYAGPIRISVLREEEDDPQAAGQRFYTTSFSSEALKGQEIEYRVYLPEGYYESDLRYPVVYMLHGYGSTGKSFEIAGVPGLLDEGIASGQIPPCIVIFPTDGHPQKASWWSAAYANMLNQDLVKEVDTTLRTVDSRDYRFLGGESMGGGGAYLNALAHPELYGGVLDIYGALRFTGALKTFLEMDAEALGRFRHYIICGNHDMYCFDLDHIEMGKHLHELKVPHVFEIDDGEHSSSFYLPRLKEGFAYILSGLAPVEETEA